MPRKRKRNDKLILAVYEFIRGRKLDIERFAPMAGVSARNLRSYLRGYYLGSISEIEGKIISVLEREQEKKDLPKSDLSFIQTSVSQRIWEACRLCHLQNDISILFGDSGIGKTAACREYVVKHQDAILLECLNSSSATFLFSRLCEQLGLSANLGLRQSFDCAEKRLRDSGRLIILEEAEHIVHRGLDLLRRLNDFTGTSIAMIGLPELLINLRGNQCEFQYLFSRVGMAIKLDTINEQDAENLVRHWLPASGDLWPVFWKVAKNNARRLSKLCRMAQHISSVNDCPIDREIIIKAAEVLIS